MKYFMCFRYKFLDFILEGGWYHSVDQQWDWTFPRGYVTV